MKTIKIVLVVLIAGICTIKLAAQDFQNPIFVKSNEKVIDYQDRPYSAPVIYDYDRDGLNDLMVGHYNGYFYVYLNKGTRSNPVFEDADFVQAAGKRLKVDNWCCIAPSGQFVDLNNDGNDDFIVGSYSGMSFICYGQKDGSLGKAEFILDKEGTPINAGKFYDLRVEGSTPAVYASEEISKKPDSNDNKGNFIKAHDYDDDGDLDLLVSSEKYIILRENIGSKRKPVFDTKYIEIADDRIFADALVDWDGDGLWDILGGSRSGNVHFYKNIGSKKSPKFADATIIANTIEIGTPGLSSRGNMSQLEVADFNNDGKLDLIVGSQIIDNIPAPEMTSELQTELDNLLEEERTVKEKRKEINTRIEKEANGDRKLMRKLAAKNEELKELNTKYFGFHSQKVKFKSRAIYHGYVVVLLSK